MQFAQSLGFSFRSQTATAFGLAAESLAVRPETAARSPRLSVVGQDASRGGSSVELLSVEAAADRRDAWLDLVRRSLEPNVFLEPDFALPAAQHIVAARRPSFLFVTNKTHVDDPGELIGVAALQLPRPGTRGLAKSWCHSQAALGIPLLDCRRSDEALHRMLDWLAREQPGVTAVHFSYVPTAGPVMALIRRYAATADLPMLSCDLRARAVLPGGSAAAPPLCGISKKHAREVRRHRRRLAETGDLKYVTSEAPDLRHAAERFLALEASGWKGARGTALLNDPGRAAFTRSMTRLLSRQGKCRIDSLELDRKPIAMAIVLTSGNRAFLWKMAYDERVAARSPGIQLIVDFTRRQSADPTISLTDSCAVPNHPMIDRLWPDRLEMADVLLAPSAARAGTFALAARREQLWRRMRDLTKWAYYRAVGGRAS